MRKKSAEDSASENNVVSFIKPKVIKTLPEILADQKETFRQKRIDNSAQTLSLRVGKESYRLVNWSRTGIAFEIVGKSSPFPVGLKVGPTKIFVGNIQVYEGDVEIRSVRETPEGNCQLGALFKSKLFLVEGIDAAAHVNQCASALEIHQEEMKEVDAEICKIIVDMGSAFKMLRTYCDDEEAKLSKMTFDERAETLSIFLPSMSREVKRIFDTYSHRLSSRVDVETIPKNTVYHRLFEEHIYPHLQTADLSRRAFEKPRGYDGDYEMMNQVYRQNYEGTDLMGKVCHHYAINTETNESVQFRRPYFLSHMESALDFPGDKHFLSIASGPAREVQDAVTRWQQNNLQRAHFVLFDLDRNALEHAQTKIYELALDQNKSVSADFINASVRSFLEFKKDESETFDLIYSGGLFDYLDNLTSTIITQSLFKLLKPKGKLVIGNFTKDVSTKGFISLILKWHLIYKTEQEMRDWAKDIPGCKISVDYDPNKINAFLVVEKTK